MAAAHGAARRGRAGKGGREPRVPGPRARALSSRPEARARGRVRTRWSRLSECHAAFPWRDGPLWSCRRVSVIDRCGRRGRDGAASCAVPDDASRRGTVDAAIRASRNRGVIRVGTTLGSFAPTARMRSTNTASEVGLGGRDTNATSERDDGSLTRPQKAWESTRSRGHSSAACGA